MNERNGSTLLHEQCDYIPVNHWYIDTMYLQVPLVRGVTSRVCQALGNMGACHTSGAAFSRPRTYSNFSICKNNDSVVSQWGHSFFHWVLTVKSIVRLLLLRMFFFKIKLYWYQTVGNRAVLRMCNKQMNFLPNQSEQAVVVPHSRSVRHISYNPNTTLQLASRPEQIKHMV